MDPASAIGTASAVVTFVQVTYEFISVAYGIAKSASEDDGDYSSIEATATEVKFMSESMLAVSFNDALPETTSKSIKVLAAKCQKLSTKIIDCISRTKPASKSNLFQILKTAVRTICSRDELATLQAQLDSCSSQLRFVVQSNESSVLSAAMGRLEASVDDFQRQQDGFREQSNLQYILNGVSFSRMKQRQNEIITVSDSTFKWIFQDKPAPRGGTGNKRPEHSVIFKEWLAKENGIFHISGKLGSGKSAVMKQIVGHAETKNLLREWAGGSSLVVGSCFFWKPGVKEQRSTAGLLRSLLHDVLRDKTHLASIIFPHLWNPSQHSIWTVGQPEEIDIDTIKSAFKILSDGQTLQDHNVRICFFIDGLDEFDDDHEIHMDLVDMLNDWVKLSGGRIKLCVSSREYHVFLERLRASHRIHMQNLNRQDISDYVCERLQRQTQDPHCLSDSGIKRLHSEIVNRSRGMFLWTTLVMKIIGTKSVKTGEPIDDVLRTVQILPQELKSIIAGLLESITEDERAAVAVCFSYASSIDGDSGVYGVRLLDAPHGHFFHRKNVLAYYFIRLLSKTDNFSSSEPMPFYGTDDNRFDAQSLSRALLSTKVWIMDQCKGLLEVYNRHTVPDRHTRFNGHSVGDIGSGTATPCSLELYTLRVGFTHRALLEHVNNYITENWTQYCPSDDTRATFLKAARCIGKALHPGPRTSNAKQLCFDPPKWFPPPIVDLLVDVLHVESTYFGASTLEQFEHARSNCVFQLCGIIMQSYPIPWDDQARCIDDTIDRMGEIHFLYGRNDNLFDEAVSNSIKHMLPLFAQIFEEGFYFDGIHCSLDWKSVITMVYRLVTTTPEAQYLVWRTLHLLIEKSTSLPSFSNNSKVDNDGFYIALVFNGRDPGTGGFFWEDDTTDEIPPFLVSFESTATMADFVLFHHPFNEQELLEAIRKVEGTATLAGVISEAPDVESQADMPVEVEGQSAAVVRQESSSGLSLVHVSIAFGWLFLVFALHWFASIL